MTVKEAIALFKELSVDDQKKTLVIEDAEGNLQEVVAIEETDCEEYGDVLQVKHE